MSGVFYVSYVALWTLVAAEAILLLLLYRHFGLAALGTLEGVQRDGLPVGEEAPPVEGVNDQGEIVSWVPAGSAPSLLLFASPNCAPCEEILPTLRELGRRDDRLNIAAVLPGSAESAKYLVSNFDPQFPCIAENGRPLFKKYQVRVTPFAFLLGEDGRVRAKGLCGDRERLKLLLRHGGLDVPIPEPRARAGELLKTQR